MNDISYIKSYWGYLRKSRRLLILALTIVPFISFAHLVQPIIIQHGIDHYILEDNYNGFITITIIFFGAITFEFLLKTLQVFLFQYIGQVTVKHIRKDLYLYCLNLPQSYFDKTPIGTVSTRLTTDVEALNESFASGLVTLLTDIITVIGIFVAMAFLNLKLSLYALILIPLLLVIVNFFRIKLRQCFNTSREALSSLNSFLQENLQGIEVVQLFKREWLSLNTFKAYNDTYKNESIRAVHYDSVLYSLIETLSSVMIGLLIWVSLPEIQSGAMTLGVLIAFIDYINKLFTPLKDFSNKFAVLQNALSALEKIFTTFNIQEKKNTSLEIHNSFQSSIVFKDLTYSYPGHRKKVLKDLSFSISKGDIIGIVGPTGSGKSTIIRVLSGLYTHYKGSITIDGKEISQLSEKSLGSLMTTVSQHVSIFSNTIRFNITLGRDIPEDRLMRVTKALQLEKLYNKFDHGLDTVLSQGSKHLSKGESQLISFARALVSEAPILVLDEATASLDSLTESIISKSLEVLSNNKTIIIIAHRLSTVKNADTIYVLRDGNFIEHGNHRDLLSKNGFYAKLYKLQMENTKDHE